MGDVVGILLLLSLVTMVASIPICIFIDFKQSERKWKSKERTDKEWMEEQLKSPRWVVSFVLTTGEYKRTKDIQPRQDYPGSTWNLRYTSKELAKLHMEYSYEHGYFRDASDMTFPACNIKEAWIEENTVNG